MKSKKVKNVGYRHDLSSRQVLFSELLFADFLFYSHSHSVLNECVCMCVCLITTAILSSLVAGSSVACSWATASHVRTWKSAKKKHTHTVTHTPIELSKWKSVMPRTRQVAHGGTVICIKPPTPHHHHLASSSSIINLLPQE